MRKVALTILCSLLLVPSLALAQLDCANECVLGLWDELGLVNNFGAMAAGTPKDIYLGVKVSAGETGLTGVEFSIAGIRQAEDGILVLGLTPLPAATVIGSAQAPADTSSATVGTGGVNIAWSECQVITGGSLAVARLQLLSFTPVVDKVFKVKRKYPVSNPLNFPNNPVLVRCDGPVYTAVRVGEGCYIAGYSGTCPVQCCVGVEQQTWSGVKQLFNN